jgi:hypothetical protein
LIRRRWGACERDYPPRADNGILTLGSAGSNRRGIVSAIVKMFAIGLAATSAAAVGAAQAQTDVAPAKKMAAMAATPAKQKTKAEPGEALTVTNERSVGLVELDIAKAGGSTFKMLVKKLGAGQKVLVNYPRGEDCMFDLHVTYVDGLSNTLSNVNLCKDGKINLVE